LTPTELRSIRAALGLSAQGLARILGVAEGRTVRRWEAGDNDIPGPVAVLLDLLLHIPGARKHLGVTLSE